jgi:UDP-N-acetylmuramyl pentapeptide phosphotransferase/UDP-N-acetylglucosamine-1-phosphate transferase
VQFGAVLFTVQRVGVILAVCGVVCFLLRVVRCFLQELLKKKKKKRKETKRSSEAVVWVNQRVGFRWVLLSSVWSAGSCGPLVWCHSTMSVVSLVWYYSTVVEFFGVDRFRMRKSPSILVVADSYR